MAAMLAEFLQEVCAPLTWQHIQAACVPQRTALQLLGCPAPFLLGTTHRNYQQYQAGVREGQGLADAVLVSIGDERAIVQCSSASSLEPALRSSHSAGDWLLQQIRSILLPQVCAYKQCIAAQRRTEGAVAVDATLAVASGLYANIPKCRFPAHIQTFPAMPAVDPACASRAEKVVHVIQSYVRCLLHGTAHCCYPTALSRGDNAKARFGGADVVKSGAPTAASALEAETQSEFPADGTCENAEDAGEQPKSMKADTNPHEQSASSPSSIKLHGSDSEACVLFDEAMFVGLKQLQQQQGSGFSDELLHAFLRSQCLAQYLANSHDLL